MLNSHGQPPLPSLSGPRLIRRFLLLVAVLLTAWASLSAKDQPVTVEGTLETLIPSELRSLLIENPYVLFKVDVGADGTLFDVMAIESNHRDLIPAATKTLLAVTFHPAIENGQAVRRRTAVFVRLFDPEQRAWNMGSRGLPFGGTVSDAVRRKMYATAEQRFVYGESQLEELDTPILNLDVPRRIQADAPGLGPGAKGRCLVEFYISPEGRARFPTALESDSDEVSISAALTLLKTRYPPPRKNGHPTFVKVRQVFLFQ